MTHASQLTDSQFESNTFSHRVYPVPHVLLLKSTLYPSFLPSSVVFFPLRRHVASLCTLLFGISSFLSTCFAPFLCDAFHFSPPSHARYDCCFYLYYCCDSCSCLLLLSLCLSILHSLFPSLCVFHSFFPILFTLHVPSLNLWFVLFICFISLFV